MSSLYEDSTDEESKAEAFLSGEIPVAVYGLGKMGLPLAAVYADVCSNVIGVDIDAAVVADIEGGECPVEGEPGLPELVHKTFDQGSFRPTTDIVTAAKEAKVHVAIVPTLIDEAYEPDLSVLTSLISSVAPRIDAGDVVFVESTVPPGACRDVLLPLIERTSSLTRGEFGLAFCPERTSSGRALEDITQSYPKVVGGVDERSTASAKLVYEQLNETGVITVTDATTAEVVKLTEGVYRDVNIGLANELAGLADSLEIDFNEAANTASTIPFINVHRPGAGVGGHCIPYYPYFFINWLEDEFPLLQAARNVNDSMPGFTVDALLKQFEAVGRDIADARILVLGVAYRANVDETRAAPAKPILSRLSRLADEVLVTDPVVDDLSEFEGTPVPVTKIQEQEVDGVVLVTNHAEFEAIDWETFDPMVIVNGRPLATVGCEKHRVYTIGSGVQSIGEF
jgi:UDP-N-acetyl-D-mannosaminuronic acid dehydrogenase